MDGSNWREALLFLGGALASAFAMVRLGMAQQRSLLDRLIAFLQSHGERQDRLAGAVEALGERISDNTIAVVRLLDRSGDRR